MPDCKADINYLAYLPPRSQPVLHLCKGDQGRGAGRYWRNQEHQGGNGVACDITKGSSECVMT